MAKKTRRQLLGQHFLHDKNIIKKIVEANQPEKSDLFIEIGPGTGALTFPLAEKAGFVLAIEKDPSLIPALEAKAAANVEIITGDILKLDLAPLIERKRSGLSSVKMAGNLPYHISTQILFVLLELKNSLTQAVFLFQKEVAQRLVAQAGTKKYSPLSILLQNYFEIELLFYIKPGAFSPPPAVDSACVKFTTRQKPVFFPEEEDQDFTDFIKASFARRRQTLKKNLEKAGYSPEKISQVLEKFRLKSQTRAEELEPQILYQVFRGLKGV
ncbi:MAG: ribosomal RNA small subunit methyltransferase A [Candidatus Saccharicenans sp.]|nr:ribosomal RNA small subunit methyltransferase A [Candidatus Saccharicenans sp.]HOJ26987.1 16S rRNA (adenine(1518)-N(6)/adenine(1519)-N(6))-dimethyltransferase RsmA [Candidatus Saccharicenans sp.]HOL46315.1 16S rRNA (adenine(1518)-N(6)/adenine(1519)-N(6))-dimethyltransferase RsmA [Candidatus Saccharicenans sp.]HPP24674.1 16S rRNA (adenine(1518)-N(6)/adenine(1519)-N(6))-dimethyltransferase RsmA [Candidatus Saccharicenans sp.]